jgi:hypothetical protein
METRSPGLRKAASRHLRRANNGKASSFYRKPLLCLREAEIVVHEIHQVNGVFPVVDAEAGSSLMFDAYSCNSPAPIAWDVLDQFNASTINHPWPGRTCFTMCSTLRLISAAAAEKTRAT